MSAISKFLALSWRDRLLLVEALLYLGGARLALLTIPFRQIAPRLGQQLPADDALPWRAPVSPTARRIGWAVETMSRHTPWESACLAQAMAGKFMLRRRGEASWLFLGTRKDEAGNLAAHAWLRSGNEILLGAGGHETFTALTSFSEVARRGPA